jgi:ActR/RegA family two-component response regulator
MNENCPQDRKRVLIVEDDPVDCQMLSRSITAIGVVATVIAVDSIRKAVSKLAEEPFDIVFVDQNLGSELGSELLKDVPERNLSSRFAILTGMPVHLLESGIYVNGRKELGQIPVFQKPIDKQVLKTLFNGK